jgi:hypothetical protein
MRVASWWLFKALLLHEKSYPSHLILWSSLWCLGSKLADDMLFALMGDMLLAFFFSNVTYPFRKLKIK